MDKSVFDLREATKARSDADVETAGPVVVAVDFSEPSEEALRWAGDYAMSVTAPIEVLHVVHDPAHRPGQYRPNGDDPLEPMADVAKRKLAEVLSRVRAGRPGDNGLEQAKSICVEGLPAKTIVQVARQRGARLLVLGSRGRTGLAELFLGSTSHEVARHAPMPVTIVPSPTKSTTEAATNGRDGAPAA